MPVSFINHTISAAVFALAAVLHFSPAAAQESYPLLQQTQVPGTNTRSVTLPPSQPAGLLNYVRTYTPKVRISDESTVNTSSSPEEVSITSQYTNGLGATRQVVQHKVYRTGSGTFLNLFIPSDTRKRSDPYSFQPFVWEYEGYLANAPNYSVTYHSSSRYPSEGGVTDESVISVAQVVNTSVPGERSAIAYAPGKSRIGQGRGTKTTAIINKVIAGETAPAINVRLWSIDAAGMPVSTGTYAGATLSGSRTQTADGGDKYVLSDRSGNPVYEAGLLRITSGIPAEKEYGVTYYIYDEMDRLRYTLPPKAVAAISAAGWTVSQPIIDELCFAYLYDADGRRHSAHKPGEDGFTELVYSKEGRTIMRRSSLEREKSLWELMFYDKAGRVIATGLFNDGHERAYWQAQANAQTAQSASSPFYYSWGAGKGQHPPKTGLSATEILSCTYFDEYPAAVLPGETYNPAPFQPYLAPATMADAPAARASVYGFQTAAEIKVVHNPGAPTFLQDWTYAKSYYDYYGRQIYSVGQNATGAKDTVYHQYTKQGQPIVKWHLRNAFHNGSNRRTTELESYAYDVYSGKLTDVYRSTNGGASDRAVHYTYDEMGRMSREILGTNAETRLYTYNVRGELLGINEDYALTGNKSGLEMSFGEALRYDHGFAFPRYDGLVSGMVWRGSGGTAVKAHSYTYAYDSAARMISAKYYEAANTGGVPGTWTTANRNYSQSASYDLNGNINSATRWGVSQNPTYPGVKQVDRLNYIYFPNSNKLQKVNDAVVTDYQTGDYHPGSDQGYSYDASGNLTEDRNKNITNVSYTWFNKPETVAFSDGSNILYSYDAGGNKLQEIVSAGTQVNYTTYISGAVYKDTVLSYISTAQGRTNMMPDTPRQEYFVKDHLGNIRSTVAATRTQTVIPGLEYSVGYELADAAVEEALFANVAAIRSEKPGSIGGNDLKAGLLKDSRQAGTSIMLKVMAGDKMDINADNFHESLYTENDNVEAPAAAIFEQIIGSLADGGGVLDMAEGSSTHLLADRMLSNPIAADAYEAIVKAATDESRPKAFLNFLFFDEEMNLLPEHSHLWQADGENDWHTIGSDGYTPLEMPQNGYIVTYLSNQTEQAAWFDNLNLVVYKGLLLDERHYYAYGLPIAGLNSLAAGANKHRQRYQGNEYIEERGLEWMDFHNRQYDPQLGRFLSIDPMADAGGQQTLSPYHAMGCNPVTMVDPLGLQTQTSTPLPGVVVTGYRPVGSVFNPFEGSAFLFGSDPWSQVIKIYDAKDVLLYEVMGLGSKAGDGIGGGSDKENRMHINGKDYAIEWVNGMPRFFEIEELEGVAVIGDKLKVWDSKDFAFLGPLGQSFDIFSLSAGKYGKYKEALQLLRYGWRPGYIPPASFWSIASEIAGNSATAISGLSLAVDAVDVAQGEMNPVRFSYHAMNFGMSAYVGAQMGGIYGFVVGLAFSVGELVFDKVIFPYAIQPAGKIFDAEFDLAMRRYFNMPF